VRFVHDEQRGLTSPGEFVESIRRAAPPSTPSSDTAWSRCSAISGDTTIVGPSSTSAAT
jgi:hypothetical protein